MKSLMILTLILFSLLVIHHCDCLPTRYVYVHVYRRSYSDQHWKHSC